MSAIPTGVAAEVAIGWGQLLGRQITIAGGTPVAGGCISPTARVMSDDGDVAFLKWGIPGDTPPGLFEAEATSLRALREASWLRVPQVFGFHEGRVGWLLMEWLQPAAATARTWPELGRGLAALHRAGNEQYGWTAHNFIGRLPQRNTWSADWPSFWRENRLEPQVRRACDAGFFSPQERRRLDTLMDSLPQKLAPAAEDGPSLVHGDLWGGNVHVTAAGEAALIDPSSYYAHREVDLAMSQLFGGFDSAFYEAYKEAWPLQPGFEPIRCAVYQLYYLLVHVNLFGSGYLASTIGALARAGV